MEEVRETLKKIGFEQVILGAVAQGLLLFFGIIESCHLNTRGGEVTASFC